MGSKGAKAKAAGAKAAATTAQQLEPLGDVTSRAMFGGHGLFREDVMFAIIDSEGRLYLRADARTAPAFEEAGSLQHSRMPYWEVPGAIRDDPEQLVAWATLAADTAAAAKR